MKLESYRGEKIKKKDKVDPGTKLDAGDLLEEMVSENSPDRDGLITTSFELNVH